MYILRTLKLLFWNLEPMLFIVLKKSEFSSKKFKMAAIVIFQLLVTFNPKVYQIHFLDRKIWLWTKWYLKFTYPMTNHQSMPEINAKIQPA